MKKPSLLMGSVLLALCSGACSDDKEPGDPAEPSACEQLAALGSGDASFTLASSAFASCAPIPAAHTCDQKPFAGGTSPALTWTDGPEGTKSYAVTFKDLSVIERTPSDDPLHNRGFHYVIWDIPASVKALPAGMMGGFASSDVPGARQWGPFNDYGYFGPCPNFDPAMPTDFDDVYAFVVYALPTETTPVPEPVAGISFPRQMDELFATQALAIAEYRGTSNAHATEPPPGPPTSKPPCPATGEQPADCVSAP